MSRWNRGLAVGCLLIGIGIGAVLNMRNIEVQAQPKGSVIPREFTSYRDVVKRVVPAVVSIESRAKLPPKKNELPTKAKDGKEKDDVIGFGSGVIIDPRGTIVTNFHVVEGAESVDVFLPDGRKFVSREIRGDRKTDLALVKIVPDKPLPFLEFGDSDSMEVGDRVLAVGSPFGLTSSVTHGIISAKARNLRLNQYEDFLQTDAAINPGNSGGPLVNLEGQVIAINSAIKSKTGGFQGVGLAISSKLVKTVIAQLQEKGTVKRGYLGVTIREIDAKLADRLGVKEGSGVIVTGVFENSPAAKSAVKVSDIIQKIDGKPVRDGDTLSKIVAAIAIGQPVEIVVLRAGQLLTIRLTIAEQPDQFGTPVE
jgi:serine protease Do